MDVMNDDLMYARDLGLIVDRPQVRIANPIYQELIPRAREGLKFVKVDSDDIDRYIGCLEDRVRSGQTGAQWILSSLHGMGEQGTADIRFRTVSTAMRMLDNVIDISRFPLEAQAIEARAKRRLGIGITGLADALVFCGARYGDDQAVGLTERWLGVIKREAYRASARLAADVANTPTVVVARTDAEAATLLTSDVDERDRPFLDGTRTSEGFYGIKNGIEPCIARAKAYAPYADLIWMETGKPDLELAKQFAEAVKSEYPDQLLAYNCSPSFNWKQHLDDATIAKFQNELGAMGFKFQFITLAGFHSLNYGMFDLAYGYARNNMSAFVELQEKEFAAAEKGFTAVKHQREVGTGYFDAVTTTIEAQASTAALKGSTEDEQFFDKKHA